MPEPIWDTWIGDVTTATISANTITSYWVNTGSTSVTTGSGIAIFANNIVNSRWEIVETPEDRERRLAREAEAAERRRQREEEAARVRERAEETLALILTPEQLEDWRRTDSFRLITQAGREYRIRRGIASNVRLIEDGEEVESLCAHPNGVPREDVVIAQVLALRTDEEHFRRTANISRIRGAIGRVA